MAPSIFSTDVIPHFDFYHRKILHRPSVWLAPILEWFIVLAVVIDILTLSVYFRFRKENPQIGPKS